LQHPLFTSAKAYQVPIGHSEVNPVLVSNRFGSPLASIITMFFFARHGRSGATFI
jgi:hypothetical protein